MNAFEVIREFEEFGAKLLTQIELPTPLTLRDIIVQLENAINDCEDKTPYISFDFGAAHPTGFGNYRRDNRHFCLEYSGEHSTEIGAKKFLEICKSSVGKEFSAWKGGEWTLELDSEIYVACEGCGSDTRVIAIMCKENYRIEIVTAKLPE